jgi:hypothetical protein
MDKTQGSVYNRGRKSDFSQRQAEGECVILKTQEKEAPSIDAVHGIDKLNSQKIYVYHV